MAQTGIYLGEEELVLLGVARLQAPFAGVGRKRCVGDHGKYGVAVVKVGLAHVVDESLPVFGLP